MLVTIRNLPSNTRYADLKALIHTKCGLTEMILDNLTPDGGNTKKVTVGLAEEADAAMVMRKINGLLIEGHQVFVEAVKKKQAPANNERNVLQQPTLQQPYYQQSTYQPAHQLGYANTQPNGTANMSYGSMYSSSTTQNAFANYGYPQQMQYQSNQMVSQSVAPFDQDAPLGFSNQSISASVWANQNVWNPTGSTSDGNQTSQQTRSYSRWDHSDNNTSRPLRDAQDGNRHRDGATRSFGRESSRVGGRDARSRDSGRDVQSRGYGRDAQTRSYGREAQSRDYGREPSSRDRGRDAPSDQRRDESHRERDSGARDYGRVARNTSARDSPYRRSDFDRAPSKRQLPSDNKFFQRDKSRSVQQDRARPNMTRRVQDDDFPPAKRTRTGFVNQPDKQGGNNAQYQTLNKKKPKKMDKESLLNRASTWRCQIASSIGRDIMKDPELPQNEIRDKAQFLTELKRGIRHRLEMMFGDNINISMEDMLRVYRQHYDVDSDADLHKEVLEDIKNHGAYVADDIKKALPPKKKEGADIAKQTLSKPKVDNGGKTGDAETVKKIPSYPQGDKKWSKELKKTNLMIFKDTDILVNKLDQNMKKALDEELDEMAALIIEEFQDEPAPECESFHKLVRTTIIDDYKQMLRVNFAKRILNISPIMLRIFNSPKIISRSKLATILAEYGVDSLRKPQKGDPKSSALMYYGTCASYEQHDKLCNMEPLVIDGSKITIKPFHLTGKNVRKTKDQAQTAGQKREVTISNAPNDAAGTQELDTTSCDCVGDQGQGQTDDGQLKCENDNRAQEEIKETVGMVENGKASVGDETQEINENDNPEKKNPPESEADDCKKEEGTKLDKEDSSEVVNTEAVDIKCKENNGTSASEVNCTEQESQNEDNSGRVDEEVSENNKTDPDKDISANPDVSEDGGHKSYDDIDMDDVDDDDLEDW